MAFCVVLHDEPNMSKVGLNALEYSLFKHFVHMNIDDNIRWNMSVLAGVEASSIMSA